MTLGKLAASVSGYGGTGNAGANYSRMPNPSATRLRSRSRL